jgi:CRP-like cAMP-binding protein
VSDFAPGAKRIAPNASLAADMDRSMKETDFAGLRALPLFAKLSPAAMAMLSRSASLDEVPARALLMRVGEIPATLCVLLGGLVQLLTPDDGDETTIMVSQPVTCFITAAVMRDEKLLMSARTVRPSRILRIEA